MNITRALEVALPDIPARVVAQRPPRPHPQMIHREHVEGGETMVRALVPGVECVFNFTPQNWQVIRLFDGQRTSEDVAAAYAREAGREIAVEDVRSLAEELDAIEFWYKTPQEKNVLLMQQSAEERRQALQRKSKWGDLAMIMFPAFNPDRFLTRLHGRIRFVFTWWFTLLTLAAFGFMIGIYITHWEQFLRDTFQFYNFTAKSGWDLAVFWGLTLILSGVHETAHGVTCKHYGGRVSSMGFCLVYLTPAFYTDTSEGVVLATPYQRIMITVAGVWVELGICAIATPLWWGTTPGSAVHELAYTIILITGVGVLLINWNPLIKLDGYYILVDLLGIMDLKEDSTAFVSAWVRKHIWRLPVEVPFVPKRRRLGFAIYALISGLYSYTVLYVVAHFVGNVFRNFNPDWSFIPELATAALIFRSRLRTLYNFMKFLYLDKKDRIRAWFTPQRSWALAATAVLLLFAPIWRESISGRFVLEPQHRAVLRALVPGTVEAVFVTEGQAIPAGAVVARLRNLPLQSQLARSQADYDLARSRYNTALLRLAGVGAAASDRERLASQTGQLTLEAGQLELKSPIAGVVLTPRPADRLSAYVTAGTELAEIGDLTTLRARIFVSEYDLYKYRASSSVRIAVDGFFGKLDTQTVSMAPASSEVDPGLIDLTKYKGLAPPRFYVVDLLVDNRDGRFRPGMAGTARLYGRRRSLAGLAWEPTANFFGRKLW